MDLEFRVFDKVDNVLMDYKTFLLTQDGKLYHYNVHDGFTDVDMTEHDVLFYTGLKDKNGVKIFEGDVLSGIYKDDVTVIFLNGSFGFERLARTSFYSEEKAKTFRILSEVAMESVEVINNEVKGETND